MKMKTQSRLLMLMILLIGGVRLFAQDSLQQSAPNSRWHFRVEPYMMFPNMSGNTGVGLLPLVSVDAGSSDILSKLHMGGMLNLEAANDKWAVNSDLLFMNLEQDAKPSTLVNSGKVNMKQLGWELAGFRRVSKYLEFGIGGLLNSLEADMNISRNLAGGGTQTQSGKKSKTWVDPMIITRLSTPPAIKKFMGQFRGEIGGFGIGSDFTWQLQVMAGYRFSKLFDITAGYRAISIDYVSGEGASSFIYDMTTYGPMVRFGFNF